MRKEQIHLNSDCDNLALSLSIFIPDRPVKGIFQISHGMAEHKERYYDFMEFLTSNGYVTIIHDHRGHGSSVKSNDDLGYFSDTKGDFIVEDLHQVSKYIKKRFPDQKLILFGHSMGSMVVRKYLKKYDNEIDALIVCGSPSKNIYAGLAIFIVKFFEIWKKDHYRSKFINHLAFGNYNKNIQDANSINAWVCSYHKSLEAYDKDPLCGYVFTLNGFENLFHLMKDIYSKKGWNVHHFHLPILFLAGSDDPAIQNYDKWIESQNFLKDRGYDNITNHIYDGYRHEILNEENHQVVYDDVLNFINRLEEIKNDN